MNLTDLPFPDIIFVFIATDIACKSCMAKHISGRHIIMTMSIASESTLYWQECRQFNRISWWNCCPLNPVDQLELVAGLGKKTKLAI